jgi:sugar transferase (PEP-CTERM/EpsH1 system associated)
MRLLWLNANLLLPLDKGGRLRTWHLMRHLAMRHDITYLCFAQPEDVTHYGHEMSAVCARLETVPRTDAPKDSLRFYGRVLRHLLDPAPYAVGAYRSRAYRQRLDALVARNSFDRVVCDFLVPAINLQRRLPCPSLLFTHNVEAEIWRRHAETAVNPVRRALYRQQWHRMRRFEGRTLAQFDRVLTVSEVDRLTFHQLYAGEFQAPTTVVPTGVDTSYFQPDPRVSPRRRHLVFVGSMDWLPNEDAVMSFCRDTMPLIRAAVPDVTLTIVGRDPTAAVQQLADGERVVVTGRVDDVRPALHEAAISIVPLRIGGGTRLKIFESMAAGTPVVSTTVGAEGLAGEPGRHLLIADEPSAFAAAVVSLLGDHARRIAMAAAARAFVVRHFDWSAVAEHLERALLDTTILHPPPIVTARRATGHPIGAS